MQCDARIRTHTAKHKVLFKERQKENYTHTHRENKKVKYETMKIAGDAL